MVTVPRFGTTSAGVPDLDEALSTLLDEEVRLIDLQTDPWSPRMTNYVPAFSLRHGVGVDSSPIHFITSTSFASMQKLEPAGAFDEIHFRPNFVIEMLDDSIAGFPEDGWIGRVLQVGDAVRL